MIALTDIEVHTPSQAIPHAVLLMDAGRVIGTGPAEEIKIPSGAVRFSLPDCKALPGFIDLHLHGLLGHDCMGPGLAEVIRLLPRFGVTGFLATTITLPMEETYTRLKAMSEVLGNPPPGARCLGIHVEGPHLSPRRPGMARAEWFHPLTPEEFERMQSAAGGWIRMVTFAPEEGDSLGMIPLLIERNVVPSIGHSDASYELVEQAVGMGLRHATHTFNAMSPIHHRAPGVAGSVLALPELTAQLIADGHHVHPGAMRALVNAKGVEHICLISDSAPFAALPPGEYQWQDYTLVIQGGTCRLHDGTLAGAHALIDTGFRNLARTVGLTPAEASICASRVPARVLGVDRRKGSLLPGFDADVVVTDGDFVPRMTIIGGEIVWRAE